MALEVRQYIRVTRRSNLAMRLFAGASYGNAPQPFYFGGLDTLRGFDFREFAGNRAAFMNLEYRFPLFDFLVGPALQISGIRGRIFFDVGAAYFSYSPADFDFWDDANNQLQDGRAAYGWGFTVDLFGLPMNWDFAKQYKFETAEGRLRDVVLDRVPVLDPDVVARWPWGGHGGPPLPLINDS